MITLKNNNHKTGKVSYVMVNNSITQDETSTSQNRLLTSKIVDLSASTICYHQLYYDVVICYVVLCYLHQNPFQIFKQIWYVPDSNSPLIFYLFCQSCRHAIHIFNEPKSKWSLHIWHSNVPTTIFMMLLLVITETNLWEEEDFLTNPHTQMQQLKHGRIINKHLILYNNIPNISNSNWKTSAFSAPSIVP